uniref:NADH-ubiquinone oxidoreductase chain 3 n=1 Tax=Dirofilaria immitis TaxID=6287 RepID=Q70UR7_DIRIM|nr:NADH dehydrogenase subunit 3 [Dirofilaria immitis]CAD61199.2 NADH dehydrogenase subunit 3 [Dirofilaria immitis]
MFLDFFVVFLFSFFVSLLMYFFSMFVSYKDFFESKVSSYECGFDVCKKVHVGFNLVFFSIVLLFVVFELEVIIFVFLVQGDLFSVFSFFMFFFYVVLSFYMEWSFGKLIWIC